MLNQFCNERMLIAIAYSDVGDGIMILCWWQYHYVGDGFYVGDFFTVNQINHQHLKVVTKITRPLHRSTLTVMLVTSLSWSLYNGDRFEMLVAE